MTPTVTSYADLDAAYHADSDAAIHLTPDEATAELWDAWCALLPSHRARFLAEQPDDARDWLIAQTEIMGAVVAVHLDRLERAADGREVA